MPVRVCFALSLAAAIGCAVVNASAWELESKSTKTHLLETTKMNGGKAELRAPSPAGKEDASARSAIVAWVTELGQLESLQAVGGWLR